MRQKKNQGKKKKSDSTKPADRKKILSLFNQFLTFQKEILAWGSILKAIYKKYSR